MSGTGHTSSTPSTAATTTTTTPTTPARITTTTRTNGVHQLNGGNGPRYRRQARRRRRGDRPFGRRRSRQTTPVSRAAHEQQHERAARSTTNTTQHHTHARTNTRSPQQHDTTRSPQNRRVKRHVIDDGQRAVASRRRQQSDGTGPDANIPADGPRSDNTRHTRAPTTTHRRKRPRNDPNTGTEPRRHYASITTTSPVKVPSVQTKARTACRNVV